jgi:hypothetical protein
VSGDEDFRDCGRLAPIQIGRNFRQQPFVRDNVFSVCPAAEQAEDPLSRLPGVRSGPNLGYLTGKLNPGNLHGKTRGRRILALALQQIGAIQG